MRTSKVLVTTTPTLSGWDIDAYLGPVFAHIVTGTGFGSDIVASFSDFFGGRSQTYQRQLSSINDEVIEILKQKASLLGGNLIIGLRVDQDEVSGKGKQMFMVTAYGTVAHGMPTVTSRESSKSARLLSSDDVDVAVTRNQIIEKNGAAPVNLSRGEWAFITENQVSEIVTQVLDSLAPRLAQYASQEEGYQQRVQQYVLNLPSEKSIPALYSALERYPHMLSFVRDTVHLGSLFDFAEITRLLLMTDKFALQKSVLALVGANKPFYVPEDIGRLNELVATIKSTFTMRGTFIEEKGKFSSSIKQRWQCECGHKNDKDQIRCGKCLKDTYGFSEPEITPTTAISTLSDKLRALQEAFD